MSNSFQHRIAIRITPVCSVFICTIMLLVPVKIISALLTSVLIHELCHVLMIKIFGYRIDGICFDYSGISLITKTLKPYQELLCAAAGPLGSVSLLLFARWIPRTALFGVIHGLYNLLPYYPMDGGRILRIIFVKIFGYKYGYLISIAVEYITLFFLFLFTLYMVFRLNMWIFAVIMIIPIVAKIKSSCKQGREGVQYIYQ